MLTRHHIWYFSSLYFYDPYCCPCFSLCICWYITGFSYTSDFSTTWHFDCFAGGLEIDENDFIYVACGVFYWWYGINCSNCSQHWCFFQQHYFSPVAWSLPSFAKPQTLTSLSTYAIFLPVTITCSLLSSTFKRFKQNRGFFRIIIKSSPHSRWSSFVILSLSD